MKYLPKITSIYGLITSLLLVFFFILQLPYWNQLRITISETNGSNSNSAGDGTEETEITQLHSQLFHADVCTTVQLDKIYDTFKVNYNSTGKTPIRKATSCPEESWLEKHYIERKERSVSPFLAVNVGCNKGLDAIQMARILSRNESFSPNLWKQALGEGISRPVCGIPKTVSLPPDVKAREGGGQVFCIEPVPSTVKRLEGALALTQYGDSFVITQAAISNTSGSVRFPTGQAGKENLSLSDCKSKRTVCEQVPMYSLDDYLTHHQTSPLTNENTSIDILLIDSEGFDYEVLQGAKKSLNRSRYVSFEVHCVGSWPYHSLVEAVQTMLQDFTCYWVGNDKLWRITNCLDNRLKDIYKIKDWSNIACASKREIQLSNTMEDIFLRTIS